MILLRMGGKCSLLESGVCGRGGRLWSWVLSGHCFISGRPRSCQVGRTTVSCTFEEPQESSPVFLFCFPFERPVAHTRHLVNGFYPHAELACGEPSVFRESHGTSGWGLKCLFHVHSKCCIKWWCIWSQVDLIPPFFRERFWVFRTGSHYAGGEEGVWLERRGRSLPWRTAWESPPGYYWGHWEPRVLL